MIQQARQWLAGRVSSQTVFSLVLLLIVLAGLVYGVSDTVRGIERNLLWPIVSAALFLGWLLAHSKVRGRWAAATGLVVGVVSLVLYVGQLGGPLTTLLAEATRFAGQVLQGTLWPEATPVHSAWLELGNGASALVTRLYAWCRGLVAVQPLFDPVPIALFWGLAAWGAAFWAAWAVRRRAQPAWAVAPVMGLLASTLAYVGGRAWYLLPMLASALLLKALVGHGVRTERWGQSGVRYVRRVRANTIWLALGLALALTMVAAITPSISVARVIEVTRSLTERQSGEEEAARSLGLESGTMPAQTQFTLLDARHSGGLPARHLIGSGPELSERVVMVVNVEAAPAGAATDVSAQTTAGYYWRSLTYDRYTDRGWSTEYGGRVRYGAGEEAGPASLAHQGTLRQRIQREGDSTGLLYVAGSLVTADRAFRVAWRFPPSEDTPGDAYGALIEADTYRADSLVPVAGETELRAAGQDYPAWIAEQYLALPDSVPDRVLALARDLTATELTPYDRALAIERHLRRFPYTLDLPSPPADRDVTDYFLFDLQKGYCDYYATAMVVLARAAGLPARLVTGYAPGTYDEEEARYVVTEADAHSWPEIYFPSLGWIEFEPTAGLAAINRPADSVVQRPGGTEAPPEPITAHRARVRRAWWLGAGGGMLVLAVGVAGAWLLVDRWRLQHLTPEATVIRLYERLFRHGRWLGVLPRQGATPREFTGDMGLRLGSLAAGRRFRTVLDAASGEVRWLGDLCTRALYSPRRPPKAEQSRAIQIWGRLRWRLWLAELAHLGSMASTKAVRGSPPTQHKNSY